MATKDERLKALEKVQAGVRIGGKGSMRRKRKTVHKKAGDEKKLQATLKRLQVNNIPGIEEINFFKEDGSVLQFTNPRRMYPSATFYHGTRVIELALVDAPA
jgi:nascent polypeptide-associated complex subunit beta